MGLKEQPPEKERAAVKRKGKGQLAEGKCRTENYPTTRQMQSNGKRNQKTDRAEIKQRTK